MYKKITAALAILAALVSPAALAVKVVTADYMLDIHTGNWKKDPYIIVDQDRISQITYRRQDIPADAEWVDLGARYLLPGVMDMHTHLMGNLTPDFFAGLFESPHRQVIGGVVNAKKTLMAGFTLVRDVGSADYMDVALRNAIEAGEVPGPRMKASGPPLGITGGHCDANALNHSFEQKSDGVADGPWEVRKQIRKNVKYGVDHIKFCATGGVFSKGTKVGQRQYTLEEMQAIVDEAHMHGRPVAAHAHGNEGIRFAIQAGVDSIEHASFLDEDTIKMAIEHGTALSMDIYNTEYTLSEGEKNGVPEENLNKERQVGQIQRDSFKQAVEMGANVVLGSDSGVYPHGDNGKQFARMVRFGMTPLQALQAATVKAAVLVKMSDDLGALDEGKFADIIAVDVNPLRDISAMENVTFVMKGGVVYKAPN